jgi:hypothetical protein
MFINAPRNDVTGGFELLYRLDRVIPQARSIRTAQPLIAFAGTQ